MNIKEKIEIRYTDKINSDIKDQIVKFLLISKGFPNENIEKNFCYIIVALNHQEVIGYILLEKQVNDLCPNIQYIEVKKEYQRIGVGTKLMNEIINYAKKNCIDRITLFPLGNSDSFFKKFGFEKEGYLMQLAL